MPENGSNTPENGSNTKVRNYLSTFVNRTDLVVVQFEILGIALN